MPYIDVLRKDIEISDAARNTVLFALRFLQEHYAQAARCRLADGQTGVPPIVYCEEAVLTPAEIDDLCEEWKVI